MAGWDAQGSGYDNYAVKVEDVLCCDEIYYAHAEGEKAPESLREHIQRCFHYFCSLSEAKNLRAVFAQIGEVLLPGDNYEKIYLEMLVNVIIFHDMGKINPAFQRIKMKNHALSEREWECLDGTKHSLLSAAIYLDYFFNYIDEMTYSKEEKDNIYVIALANAYIISRHHGELTDFQKFSEELGEGGKLYSIFEGMEKGECALAYRGPFYQGRLHRIARKSRLKKFFIEEDSVEDKGITLYTYIRLLYSVLVSCDYYATSEYKCGLQIRDFGRVSDVNEMKKIYESSPMLRRIRTFHQEQERDDGKDINYLRNSMFYEAEGNLLENKDKFLFFLEAPTGGGKSNISMNCSFQLLNDTVRKIFYIYPFNTLVEQNLVSLERIFGGADIFDKIAVINSITPIKSEKNKKFRDDEDKEENDLFYRKALLDRQFLNYPFVLTTHVHLFQMMFDNKKEEAVSFYQLVGSVIVLDEIQSYKNTIWTEIITFLTCYSKLLNMKVIIMSATLPRLDDLTNRRERAVNLIGNRARYFEDARFRSRVKISYELMKKDKCTDEEELCRHILTKAVRGKKILVEFICKRRAEDFYLLLLEKAHGEMEVLCMTGDDNQLDRAKTLRCIAEEETDRAIILVATQVVEAGVDIDMDIGYKDISKLDSEEQFLGRINRNFRKEGEVYFFNMDSAAKVYQNDFRINKSFTLEKESMRDLLDKKDFHTYYSFYVLKALQEIWNSRKDDEGLEAFWEDKVEKLNFPGVAERMRLIDKDRQEISVFLARNISLENGEVLKGAELWEEYKSLLADQSLEYAQKQVKLSEIRSKMNYFIYKFNSNSNIMFSDFVGELYCVEDAEKYFENGRLNKERFKSEGAMFIDV